MPEKRYFTTFEVGRICGVFPSTVVNWIRSGKLKASQTPGGHRRIPRDGFLAFMKEFGYDIPPELAGSKIHVFVVDDDRAVARMIGRIFAHDPRFAVRTVGSGVDAIIEMGKTPPDVAIIDVVMPKVDGEMLVESLKANPETRGVKLIGISGKRLSPKKLAAIRKNVDAFFAKPLSPKELLACVLELTGTLAVKPAR